MTMDLESILTWILLAFLLWGIPLGFIVSDPIVSRKERIIWVFATLFVTWFAWLLFLWVAPVLPKKSQYE